MYCPTCGTKLAQALSYCNHCGASLPTSTNRSDASVNSVIWVIVGTTITLLGMGLGALVLMKDESIDPSLGKVFVMLSFLGFVVVESVLVWRLLNLQKLSKQKREMHRPQDSDQVELNEARTRALSDPGEPIPPITEQTTRDFEPSHRDHKRQSR